MLFFLKAFSYLYASACVHVYIYIRGHQSVLAVISYGPSTHFIFHWDLGLTYYTMLTVNQVLGIPLFLSPQFWDYQNEPPCMIFYLGAGNQVQILMFTKQALYQLLSPCLFEHTNFFMIIFF